MRKRKLRIGVIRFPGSNCDFDTVNFFKKFGHNAEFVWYKNVRLPSVDLIVLPGGFAFGDRVYAKATGRYHIDPGALAATSSILAALKRAAGASMPILGVCNGFQILVKAGLLPGALAQNDSKKFFCDSVPCRITGASFFEDASIHNKTFIIPVAHGYGKYVVSKKERAMLAKNGQIFLEYARRNPNGSVANIAGVCNKERTIFGMMPHPERSPDGHYFMHAIEKYVSAK